MLNKIIQKELEKKVKKIREEKWECRGLSGRADWKSIDDLPLNEAQKACVLEWIAQKLQQTKLARECDVWQMGKSYDPLDIKLENKTAHSYVMEMSDGGRHHKYNKMSEIEDAIFNEFFGDLEQTLSDYTK